jgi:peptidylprolyl isomerase
VRAHLPLVAAVALAAAVAAGCTAGGQTDDVEPAEQVEADVDLGTKPDAGVFVPDARDAPPGELVVVDVVVGDGPEAVPGASVEVHYVGVSWSDGMQFDASWDRGETFSFELGAGRVIPGWDQGVAGMRVGGRRALTIPPELAYGERGAGGVIGPNETLVFVVDLLGVSGAGS